MGVLGNLRELMPRSWSGVNRARPTKPFEKLRVLLIQLEFEDWFSSRSWSYTGSYAVGEGLVANGVETFILPAIGRIPPHSPASWLRMAREMCQDQQFDQVWLWLLHVPYDDSFLDWISEVAPVRVGVVCESLHYHAHETAEAGDLDIRKKIVIGQMRAVTHVLCVDERDAEYLNAEEVAKAAWWPASVPKRFIFEEFVPPASHYAAFYGHPYKKRKGLLEHPDLRELLAQPRPPEDSTDYPAQFDHLQRTTAARLQSGEIAADMQALDQYVKGLYAIRGKIFSNFLDSLKSWSAIVNPPSYVKSYPGRVVEAMAAGRPVISWEVPDRPRTKALFTDDKEILLFHGSDPSQLAERIQTLQGNPDLGRWIVRNAREKILQYHTAEGRVRQILEWVQTGNEPDYGEKHDKIKKGCASVKEVEFADYLLEADYRSAINHPLFKHIMFPPDGYTFTHRPRDPEHVELLIDILNHLDPNHPPRLIGHPVADAALGEIVRVAQQAIVYGGNLRDIREFFITRHVEQNARLPHDTRLAFIHTVPYSLYSVPWVIEIEDSTTLFFPYLRNGQTFEVEVSSHHSYPVLKAHLESDTCKAIITHVRSTAENLPVLFGSEVIRRKVFYAPLGVPLPDISGKKVATADSEVNLLFTNSWHQDPAGFCLRGGYDVLEAFSILAERYPHVNLIIRSALPYLNEKHAALVSSHPRIKLIDRFLQEEELHHLMLATDIYVIPAARLHTVSVLNAMAYGIPVVASDGWGFAEYVTDGVDGFLIPGRYGVCSWVDNRNGMLREDYRPIHTPDGTPSIIEGLVNTLSRLIENAELRGRMSLEARRSVETKYSLHQWNGFLKMVFDGIFE